MANSFSGQKTTAVAQSATRCLIFRMTPDERQNAAACQPCGCCETKLPSKIQRGTLFGPFSQRTDAITRNCGAIEHQSSGTF
jgi:hypothetical protein